MRVHDLNEELLNELNMDDVKKDAKKSLMEQKKQSIVLPKLLKTNSMIISKPLRY